MVVAQLRRPSVAGSLLGGAIATGLVALLGLVLGLLFPDEGSIIGFLGADTDIVGETLRQAVSFLQISFDSVSLGAEAQPGATVTGRVTPLLFAVFPVGACALGAAVVLGRDPQAGPTARVIVCAGVTLTFALLMLIAALAAGEADPSAGGAFLLGLLWGGLGALWAPPGSRAPAAAWGAACPRPRGRWRRRS